MAARKPTRRPPTTVTAPVVAAQPPLRQRNWPAWYHRGFGARLQHDHSSVGTVVEEVMAGRMRLPVFQRAYVWTDDQIARLWDSLLRGYHVGNLLLWQRYDLPPTRERFAGVEVACAARESWMVVDGQQRLGAILDVAQSGRWFLDLATCGVTTEPGPWRLPARLAMTTSTYVDAVEWPREHAAAHGLPVHDVYDATVAMLATLDHVRVSAVRMDGDYWTLPRVLESYRRMATEGTPHDPAALEAALLRAMAESTP